MTAEPTPSFLDLLRFRESGRASDELSGALDSPGGECARRLAVVDDLRDLLGEARAEPVSARLQRAVRDVPRRSRGSRGSLRELVARLVPRDPGDAVPAFRGAPAAAPVLYRAGEWEVDVTRTPRGSVVGQVLPVDPDAPLPSTEEGVALLCGGAAVLECELDSGGGFRFPAVDPGRYLLVLGLDGSRVVIPDVDLGGAG